MRAAGGCARRRCRRPGRYIRGFDELADRNNAVVRRLFERAAADPVTPIDHKVGAFWSASARSHECPHPARTDS